MGDEKQVHICSICGKEFVGYTNDAYPVNNGECCDLCNWSVVIPARIEMMDSRGDT